LVSRCFREKDRRILTVFDIWAVSNIMYQVSTDRKRRRVAAELFVCEDEMREATAKLGPASATDSYLEKNGFACVDATVPTEFLLLPTGALILLCEFL
jgi:hypothetical protein